MGQSGVEISKSEGENIESKIDAANTMELEQTPLGNLLAKSSSGGELVGKEDLWNCLFRQKPGQVRATRYSREAEQEVARHLGAVSAEARMGHIEEVTNVV